VNDRQKAFALALVESGGDAEQAALAAGYSERFARSRSAADLAARPEMAGLLDAVGEDCEGSPGSEKGRACKKSKRRNPGRAAATGKAAKLLDGLEAADSEIVGPIDRQRFLTTIIRDDQVDVSVKLRALDLLERSQAREADKPAGMGLEDAAMSDEFRGLRARARVRLRRLLAIVFEVRQPEDGGPSRLERLLTERLGEAQDVAKENGEAPAAESDRCDRGVAASGRERDRA